LKELELETLLVCCRHRDQLLKHLFYDYLYVCRRRIFLVDVTSQGSLTEGEGSVRLSSLY
jgi:hypothetical protein